MTWLEQLNKLPEEKVIGFTKQLYFLLKAGIPIYRALQIINHQTLDVKLREISHCLTADLSEGRSFADSLADHNASFSNFYISMVRVGENRGELEESLQKIYQYLESRRETRQKIVNSLTYPVTLIVAGITVLILMLFFVLPKFVEIFTQSGMQLPLPTRILIKTESFLQVYYPFILILLIAIVITYSILNKSPQTKEIIDAKKLKLPIFGELLTNVYVARFCRAFSTLYASGMQLLPALELSKNAVNNLAMQNEITRLNHSVRDGKGLAKPLSESKLFPKMMTQMLSIGEETGSLEKILLDVAVYYEQESDFLIKRQMALLEPFALLLISLMVTFIAASVMLPLFRMAGSMRSF